MIPNPSNSILGNNGQPTFEEIQQRLAQQVQNNQNPNTAQQLIDLLNQSSRAMGMVPGAGAEADQTLQQLNPTGTQSMQNMQNMRQEIEQERATDEYPFYDEKQLQAEFERQKRAKDKQWQGFISSYKQEMKDKINQEHKDHVTFMTATGGTPLNLGEFAQQTGYLGGNKLQEAWEAHKEEAKNAPPSTLYDDYNQTFLDTMEHRYDFEMERYNLHKDKIKEIQERISEHHAKGVDDLSQEDRYEVQNLMRSLSENARHLDILSGTQRNSRNKEAEVHIRNIFPNGFNPSIFKNAILASDPDEYFKQNFKLSAHDVQHVTAEHHLAEVHPRTLNRIKESNLPSELKNSIINSNSLTPLYEQLTDDIIEAHEVVDYTDGSKGIGNRIHEGLKEKYGFLTLEDEIKQPTISFEKLLYNKFSKSTHQDVDHLKATMAAFNTHYDDDDVHRGKIFPYGMGNGLDYDIFRHLVSVNKEKQNEKLQGMFKSPLDYVIDNLIAKAYLPTLRERGRDIEDQVALRWIPSYRESTFNAPISLNRKKGNIIHEQRLRNQRLKASENSAHEERVTLPGVFDDDSSTNPSNTNITGSWVAPATQLGAMGADVSFHDKGTLMAINEKPDWWRTVRQGAAQESPGGEGFKYGGYDKEAFSKIPTPNVSPISMLHYQMALENPMYNEDEVAQQFPNQHELIQQFPNVDTRELWGEPATLASTINPINPRKVASEPMNIAFQLLKQSLELQPPMTQGVEEEQPIEEETPMIDVSMGDYKTPCECAEEIRQVVLSIQQKAIDTMAEMNSSPQDPKKLEYVEKVQTAHFESFGRMEDWYTMSCEEILQWVESTDLYHYKDMLEQCQSGMSESDQMKYTGEPMEIAMRLLKNDDGLDELSDDDFYLQYLFGNAPSEMNERQRMVADAALDLPESYLAEEGWDSNSMSDLFHPDPNVHESIPDHEYELAASKIKHFKDEINSFMSNPDLPKDDFMDDLEHPKHPWNLAQAKAEKEMSARNVMTGEPMDLAMRLLKANEGGQPTVPKPRYHEMSQDELNNLLHGWGYDFGTGKYTTDESLSTQEEKDAAYQELLNRQREAEANPVSVFGLNDEEKSRLVDFYEPQFTGQNIDPDTFIPQTEKEGLEAYEDMEEGELDEHIEDRLLAIDEFMPGKSFMLEQDPMAKYHYLKTTAGDEVAENYLNRYRDFVMRHSENPEYMYQQLMQMFGEIPEVTAPQYTQEFPTDESIFDNKPPNVMMNTPDATGFEYNWQAKNASEPMDLAMDVLLKDRISPEAKRHKLEYDKKYESSPERVKYREELNRERRNRGIYGKHNHMDVSHTEGGKLTLESEHGNRARHFKEKGTLRHEE